MKSLRFVPLIGVLFIAVLGFGRTYYIPHIHTASDAWETYLVVDNLDLYEAQGFYLTLYAADGSVIVDRQYYEVGVGQSTNVPLRPLNGVAGEAECGSESVRFRLGYVAKASTGGGTAEFDLPESLSDNIVFSTSNYYGQLTWSGFAVFNGSDTDVIADVTVMSTSGTTKVQLNIPSKTKIVNYFDTQFEVAFSEITDVIFTADVSALTGITISGNENEKLLFTGTGENKSGWTLKNKGEYSVVNGIGQSGDTILAFCRSYDEGEFTNFMKGIRVSDGLPLYEQSAAYTYLFPMGMATSSDGSVSLAFGMDTSDSVHAYYFVGRVNPDNGTLLWKTTLAEGFNPSFNMDDRFSNRICVATDGSTTVQANMLDKNKNFVRYMINLNTGVTIATSTASVEILPTTLVFDSTTGMYYSIYSQYDTVTSTYSKVYFYKNSTGSLAGSGSFVDLSTIIPDSAVHHVLVYGGGITGGTMHLLYNVTVGAPDPHAQINGPGDLSSQFINGSVPLSDFHPSSASKTITSLTGLLGDSVHIVKYGSEDVFALCGEISSANLRTFLIDFSGYWRTLPVTVRAATDNGIFMLGFIKEQKYSTTLNLKRHFKGDNFSYPGVDTFIQRISYADLMNEF